MSDSPMRHDDIVAGIASLIDPSTAEAATGRKQAEVVATDQSALDDEQAVDVAMDGDEAADDGAPGKLESDFELVLQRHGEEYRITDPTEATRLANLGLHFNKQQEEFLAAKRAFDGEVDQFRQTQQAYAEALPAIESFIQAPLGERPTRAQYQNAEQFAAALDAWDQGMAQVQAVRQEMQRVQTEQQQEAQRRMEHFLQEADARTLALIPEWSDQSVLQKEAMALKQYALEAGFSEAHLSNPFVSRDPAFLTTIRKAWQWDQARKSGRSAVEEVKQRTKDAPPGAGGDVSVNQGAKSYRDHKEQIRQRGGRVDDVSVLMDQLLSRSDQIQRTR